MDDKIWGRHTVLDLSGCPTELISDAENILKWGNALVRAIDMVAYGKPLLEHFAVGNPKTAGYTYVQLIETSNICAHFAENLGGAYIDIFSCKDFSPEDAENVTREFFKPAGVIVRDFYR